MDATVPLAVPWASLWSDAALLYRRELELDVNKSAMAVVVQELVAMDRSGVGFGIDPSAPGDDLQVIKAVPGLCRDLVDGAVEPDRWRIVRSSGEVLHWHPGNILAHQPMIASERNTALSRAADWVKNHPALRDALHASPPIWSASSDKAWIALNQQLTGVDGGRELISELDRVRERYMDVVHDGIQLDTRPDLLLPAVMELVEYESTPREQSNGSVESTPDVYEQRLLEAHRRYRSAGSLRVLSIRIPIFPPSRSVGRVGDRRLVETTSRSSRP